MSDAVRGGALYPRLVPASLLTPPDSPVLTRTVRDWVVDVLAFLLTAAAAVVLYAGTVRSGTPHVGQALLVLDWSLGIVGTLLVWLRRRWPVGVGVVTVAFSTVSISAAAAATLALFTVAIHRRTAVTVALAVANVGAATVFLLVRPQDMSFVSSTFFNVAIPALIVAWGMFVRARRQLVLTLHERVDRAEREQRMLAEQARLSERTRIAREMHDVLAHRISLVALHAGGLQVRPDLGPEQVRDTATLLRATAQQALEELRDVIGVLRGEAGIEAPSTPQPTLTDIARLVDDSRDAGARIDFTMDVPPGADAPGSLGRDAYRIVQEALTNVAKHAQGTATTVRVHGAPGDGLRVDVRNRLPLVATESALPGSGSGLLGLSERVALGGGTLTHGPDGGGQFVVEARLPW